MRPVLCPPLPTLPISKPGPVLLSATHVITTCVMQSQQVGACSPVATPAKARTGPVLNSRKMSQPAMQVPRQVTLRALIANFACAEPMSAHFRTCSDDVPPCSSVASQPNKGNHLGCCPYAVPAAPTFVAKPVIESGPRALQPARPCAKRASQAAEGALLDGTLQVRNPASALP